MNVLVEDSTSVLLQNMQGSILPIAVAHGEGRVNLSADDIAALSHNKQIAMRYVDSKGYPTEHYPLNPNGSTDGITALCNTDGRITIMMPHPERTLRAVNHAYKPDTWQKNGAWLRLFQNARLFVK